MLFDSEKWICRYAIGLDVGIASVGYAVVALDSVDQPFRIVRIGSRVFDKAENPKTGESLALPRREARSMRRRLRRKRHRLERIRRMIVSYGILTSDELDNLYSGPVSDIYELRVHALDEAVSKDEFARILINLAQRRGFKSNRKNGSSKEDGDLLKAVNKNKALMEQNNYRTVGEMLYLHDSFADHKRNKGGEYKNTVSRDDIENEVHMIFDAQRRFGSAFASEEIEMKYLDVLLSQRSFAEGPAEPSPYAGNQVEIMRGTCTLKGKEYPRAPKASFSFQDFNLWQHINHIRVQRNGSVYSLDEIMPGSRQMLHDWIVEKGSVSFYDIRLKLKLPETDRFSGVSYSSGKAKDKDDADIVKTNESKKKLDDMKICAEIRKCVNKAGTDSFISLSVDHLDTIGEALSKNSNDEQIMKELQNADIDTAIIEQLLTLDNFPKFGHISVAACRELIPYLKEGDTYDKACENAGYNFRADDRDPSLYLPSLSAEKVQADVDEITSPVVRRAVSQTIKLVNAIIREMNETSPVYVNIELARELSRSLKERNEIEAGQKKNADANERIRRKLIDELHISNPGGLDIVKLKLWEEQDGVCPYSGERISIERLSEAGYVEVDHIIPYSRCFDDRMVNKVLVMSRENREKGNRLPLEYLTGDKRDRFCTWVETSHLKYAKVSRLLKEKMTDEDEKGFRERNLVDTQFISSFLNRYISRYLAFSPFYTKQKRHVLCVNGAITAYTRARWGISKIRANGDVHHAVDALVIACITQGMVNRVNRYTKYHELEFVENMPIDPVTGEVFGENMTESEKKHFPLPWPGFRTELDIRLMQNEHELLDCLTKYDDNYRTYEEVDLTTVKPVFVSRMSDHKTTGAAHKDTFRSAVLYESEGKTVVKESLDKLKLSDPKDTTDSSLIYRGKLIEGYYNPDSDRLLYEALIDRLIMFGGDGKKAFAEPFYKPKSNGERGPLVRSVKTFEIASSAVPVLNGNAVADNDRMIRTDVFYVDGEGYYFVPIYVSDTVKSELPDIAPVAGKDANGRKKSKKMNDSDFCFSLYKNDLICIVSSKDMKLNVCNKDSTLDKECIIRANNELFLYYRGMDVSVAFLSGITNDGSYEYRSIGKTVKSIEKYSVDVLGNISKCGKEERRPFR